MKKGIVKSVSERNLDDPNGKHVIIERDETGAVDPLHDWDQVFLLHSNIPREFCGNERDKNYVDPLEEILDEEGFGTGKYTFKKDVVAFPVSAYIHSGIALSMGSIREFPCDPGGWDTTPNAAYLWTDKERFEKMSGKWMTVYDEETKSRRPAKDEAEFREYLYGIAKGELETLQKCWDGEVFGFRTEVAVPYTRTYRDGSTVECVDWDDGLDSCWGYVVDSVSDIEFPRDDGWEVFDASGYWDGKEYDIPEFVVTQTNPEGTRTYLCSYKKEKDGVECAWTGCLADAITFPSWWKAQSVAQDVIEKERYDADKNCIEKDSIKEEN